VPLLSACIDGSSPGDRFPVEKKLRDNCWVLHNFFLVPTPELNDTRPRDYLADPSKDMQRRFIIDAQGAA